MFLFRKKTVVKFEMNEKREFKNIFLLFSLCIVNENYIEYFEKKVRNPIQMI